jgi:hypothetical protein
MENNKNGKMEEDLKKIRRTNKKMEDNLEKNIKWKTTSRRKKWKMNLKK